MSDSVGMHFFHVCCCRRLVNRSGDVCDRDRWLSRKTNTHCYNIVENWIRLLLSAFPLPPLMVPVCLPCMAKCWLLYINVFPSPRLPQAKVIHASSSTCLLHTWTFTAPVTGQESTGFVKHWCLCLQMLRERSWFGYLLFFFVCLFFKGRQCKQTEEQKSCHFTIWRAECDSSIFRSLSTEYLK